MESILSFVINCIVDIAFYGTAKTFLPIISLGKWRVDIRKSKENWLSGLPFARRDKDGILYFGFCGSVLFGCFFWLILVPIAISTAF
ncbi:MAG: hypothetical protein PHW63_01960 [Alphaproteobacteria bacterium]|nr:hypothetical protein [Alphaproteobacteria bacterium]